LLIIVGWDSGVGMVGAKAEVGRRWRWERGEYELGDLTSLIAKRERIILKIAKTKKETKENIVDVKREEEVLKRAKRMAGREKISQLLIERIIKMLIKYAREIQK